MGRQDIGVAEGLRRLHATQRLAVGAADHQSVRRDRQAIDNRQDRDGRRMLDQSREQPIDDFTGAVGTRGVVNEDVLGGEIRQGLEACQNRILSRRAARDEPYPLETAERGSCRLFCILRDRKSTRLNSSHVKISYAVFCLKKKTKQQKPYSR